MKLTRFRTIMSSGYRNPEGAFHNPHRPAVSSVWGYDDYWQNGKRQNIVGPQRIYYSGIRYYVIGHRL